MKTKNAHQRIRLSDSAFVMAILAVAAGLVGCTQNRPGFEERTDKQTDQVISSTGGTSEDIRRRSLGEQAETAGEYINDEAISRHIKADLLNDSLLSLSNINVTANAGVVTLSGTVNSQQAMDRAVEIARRHRNVKSVENKLLIKAPSRI